MKKLEEILNLTAKEDLKIIDCEKLYIAPGMVDMRVNIGEPGSEHKETIKVHACRQPVEELPP